MPQASPHSLAIVGAGPVGLEAAFLALDQGFDVHVFERGEVAAHPIAWGHVRMFTPWRMNLGPSTAEHLRRSGWQAPDPEACPTGLELAERALLPAAALPEIRERIHMHSQVVHVGRRGALKADHAGKPERRDFDFRLLVRDAGGRENFLHAHSLIDASGVYGSPNWAGDGGIPARGELYLAPQLSYHVDDVLGLRRERYAGKRTLVIGGGSSAATVAADLARLATEHAGGSVAWATREPLEALYPNDPGDPLEGRCRLADEARALLRGSHPGVSHVGGVWVEGFEFNSATHRYRVLLRGEDRNHVEEVDQVIVNHGFGPDTTMLRELQVAAPVGSEPLTSREPGFFVAGNKSYGRAGTFLLEAGYRQAADALTQLRTELGSPQPA